MLIILKQKFLFAFILFFIVFLMGKGFARGDSSEEILRSAGLSPEPEKLVEFLEKGSLADLELSDLTEKGIPATQLLISAIQEISVKQYKPAVPQLIQIAKGNFSPGQKTLINYDCETVSPSSQQTKRKNLNNLLQYNAINALGLLRDSRAVPVLQELYAESPPGTFKINICLALACLDQKDGMEYLVKLVQDKNRKLAAQAASSISLITNMEIDYNAYTPIIRRKKTIKQIKEWWKTKGKTFEPEGEEIVKRRLNMPPKLPPSLRSVRELVKAASNYGDLDNKMRSLDAREKLSALGATVLPQLKPVCLDEKEDLNIRMEAIRRYSRLSSRGGAEELLKQTKRDDNPEISSLSKDLLKFISSSDDTK